MRRLRTCCILEPDAYCVLVNMQYSALTVRGLSVYSSAYVKVCTDWLGDKVPGFISCCTVTWYVTQPTLLLSRRSPSDPRAHLCETVSRSHVLPQEQPCLHTGPHIDLRSFTLIFLIAELKAPLLLYFILFCCLLCDAILLCCCTWISPFKA